MNPQALTNAATKAAKDTSAGFLEFISRGNVIEMSVGVVLGGAFTAIVNSFVQDVLTPALDATGSRSHAMEDRFLVLKSGKPNKQYATADEAASDGAKVVRYGKFLQAAINFVMQGFVLFLMVKLYQKASALTKA